MILGVEGPIQLTDDEPVLMLESFLFDRTGTGHKLETGRISLENRWAIFRSPDQWMDNVIGSIEGLDYELRNSDQEPFVICLHSNDLVLNSNKETISRLKSISQSYAVKIILSISVPKDVSDENQGVEYLVSHVHYGLGNGSIFFGMIGPLVIIDSTTPSEVRMYTRAQKKAGNVLLVCEVNSSKEQFNYLSTEGNFNFDRTVFFGNLDRTDIIRGMTFRSSQGEASYGPAQNMDSVVMSSGIRYKTDMKKYGGNGIDFSFMKKRVEESEWKNAHSIARKLLQFDWEPPKLNVKAEDSPKWICHICGFVAKLDEQENYTKHGFTYCSISCLSQHRKKNFQP